MDGVEGNLEGGWPASAQLESHLALALNSTSCHRLRPSNVGSSLELSAKNHRCIRSAEPHCSGLLLTPDLATLHILLIMWFTIFNTYY